MSEMKINLDHRAEIDEALSAVNGTADRHTFTSVDDLWIEVSGAEEKLERLCIPQAKWSGVTVTVDSGDKLPSSYRGRPVRTCVTLLRGARDWFLVAASRIDRDPRRMRVIVTPEQLEAGVNAQCRALGVDACREVA